MRDYLLSFPAQYLSVRHVIIRWGMYFCQWDFRGLIMMVGYSDCGQDEAIAKLHGKGSE